MYIFMCYSFLTKFYSFIIILFIYILSMDHLGIFQTRFCLQNIFSYLKGSIQKLSWKERWKYMEFSQTQWLLTTKWNPHFVSNWTRDGLSLVPISSSQTIFATGLATHPPSTHLLIWYCSFVQIQSIKIVGGRHAWLIGYKNQSCIYT